MVPGWSGNQTGLQKTGVKLPRIERARMRDRLTRLGEMTPEEQQALRRRLEGLLNLSPEQRDRVRDVLKKWHEMSPAERRQIRERLRERIERREQK